MGIFKFFARLKSNSGLWIDDRLSFRQSACLSSFRLTCLTSAFLELALLQSGHTILRGFLLWFQLSCKYFYFLIAGAGGPGTVYLGQVGLGIGTLIVDSRGKDTLIKQTSDCGEFDVAVSGKVM